MNARYRIYVWIMMILGGALISVLSDLYWFRKWFLDLRFHLVTFITGILLLRFVLTVSKNTGRTLAKYGRKGNIPKFDTNVLVSQGPYAYMRHPMHLGLLFFPLSIALIIGSLTFIFIVAPLEMIFMLLMIYLVEEPEARQKFGKQYEEFIRNKPWFCFKIKCLKALLKKVDKTPGASSPMRGCI